MTPLHAHTARCHFARPLLNATVLERLISPTAPSRHNRRTHFRAQTLSQLRTMQHTAGVGADNRLLMQFTFAPEIETTR